MFRGLSLCVNFEVGDAGQSRKNIGIEENGIR